MNTQHDPASAPPPPGTAPDGAFPGGAAPRLFGLARPQNGRYVAGVCAGIGRATNTDPVLWRVLLAVLAVFGGAGLLIYLAAWLIIPAEGDSGSPLENVLGKGQSSTSPITVAGLTILALVTFAYIMSDTWRAMLLVACAAVVGALIVNRGRIPTQGAPAPAPPPPSPTPASPDPAPGVPPVPPNDQFPTQQPGYAPAPPPWQAPPAGGYRPPFAPHGPYHNSPYTATNPPPAPPRRPRPPKPPKERSPLFGAVFSVILMAIGVLAIIDLSNLANPAAPVYFAAALTIIGVGMLVGTRWGRGRGLIAPGLAAALALGISVAASSPDFDEGPQSSTLVPKTLGELPVRYGNGFGDTTVDLRNLDFTGQDKALHVEQGAGELTVLLPPSVDVIVDLELGAGSADVLGRTTDGVGKTNRVEDFGDDGEGGGRLALTISNGAGDVEVTR